MNTNNTNSSGNGAALERALTSMTTSPDASPGLWRKALDQTQGGAGGRPAGHPSPADAEILPFWKRQRSSNLFAVAASLFIFVLIGAAIVPQFTKAREEAQTGSYRNRMMGSASSATLDSAATLHSVAPQSFDISLNSVAPKRTSMGEQVPPSSPGLPTPALTADRFVIRKATLDLTSPQVRSTFSKVGMVINEALGEYVETSSLTGEGPTAAATITLRVASSRLSEVLNQLRPLGTVTSEAATGQDVTENVVDLEARIRNEQRIERELLALIDKRPDAPLKELMEIRAQLATVRGQIESLAGQRERLGRLVSLATVLVSIRTADSPKPVEKADSIGDYFLTNIASAWSSALHALADTAAFFIRVVIGGIVWWMLLVLAAVMAGKLYRRAQARLAAEPAPAG